MNEILRLIKEVIGVRPLVPVLAIIVLGFVMMTLRRYSARELAQDRLFVMASLVIVFAGLAHWIWTSFEAQRTGQGRMGIYVARLRGDGESKQQRALIEHLTANLKTKAMASNLPVDVHDLKREISPEEENEEQLTRLLRELNAAVIVWGSVVGDGAAYLRTWKLNKKLERRTEPSDLSDLRQLGELSEEIWTAVTAAGETDSEAKRYVTREEYAELRAEVTALRSMLTTSLATSSAGGGGGSGTAIRLSALLIGVSNFKDGAGVPPLRGPVNDIQMLSSQLRLRYPQLTLKTLQDGEATRASIEARLDEVVRNTPQDVRLLVYFSGHSFMGEDKRTGFIPYDASFTGGATGVLWFDDVIRKITPARGRSVVLIDGALSRGSIPAEIGEGSFVLAAGAQPSEVFETTAEGKTAGAFTHAVVRTLSSVPVDSRVEPDKLYSAVAALLKSGGFKGKPVLAKGKQAEAL